MWPYLLFAVAAGAMLPIQFGINAQLATWLGQPGPGDADLLRRRNGRAVRRCSPPSAGLALERLVAGAPWWVWVGGLLGAFYVLGSVVTAPKLGAATLVAVDPRRPGVRIAAWSTTSAGSGFEENPITPGRLLGIALVAAGVALVRLLLARLRTRPADQAIAPIAISGDARSASFVGQSSRGRRDPEPHETKPAGARRRQGRYGDLERIERDGPPRVALVVDEVGVGRRLRARRTDRPMATRPQSRRGRDRRTPSRTPRTRRFAACLRRHRGLHVAPCSYAEPASSAPSGKAVSPPRSAAVRHRSRDTVDVVRLSARPAGRATRSSTASAYGRGADQERSSSSPREPCRSAEQLRLGEA